MVLEVLDEEGVLPSLALLFVQALIADQLLLVPVLQQLFISDWLAGSSEPWRFSQRQGWLLEGIRHVELEQVTVLRLLLGLSLFDWAACPLLYCRWSLRHLGCRLTHRIRLVIRLWVGLGSAFMGKAEAWCRTLTEGLCERDPCLIAFLVYQLLYQLILLGKLMWFVHAKDLALLLWEPISRSRETYLSGWTHWCLTAFDDEVSGFPSGRSWSQWLLGQRLGWVISVSL